MAVFIQLVGLLLAAAAILFLLTQVIVPSLKGTKAFPAFQKKRKAKQLQDVKTRIEDVDADLHIQDHKEVLHSKKTKLQIRKDKLSDKKKK
jgi:hypothetical protein